MSESRRKFLKKSIALAGALPVIGASSPLFANNISSELNNDELLIEFENWVDQYVLEIKKEKELGREFKDNKALVELPDQMEKMMPIFKSRFNDPNFRKQYLQISRKLSAQIDSNF